MAKQPAPKPMKKTAPKTAAPTPKAPVKTTPAPVKKRSSGASTLGCVPDRMHASVSVRKIDNGYIVSESCDGPKGYTHNERYVAEKPKIVMPSAQTSKK